MGQWPVPAASTSLTVLSAAAISESGDATFSATEEPGGNSEPNANKPTSAAEEKIKAALGERTDLRFSERPLGEAIEEIAARHEINVLLDIRALDDVGVGPDIPVTLNLSGVSLESTLTHMLRRLELTWVIHAETLLITTPEEAENILITQVYDVGDLVKFQDKDGKEWADYDTLIGLITSTIGPDSWDEVGGAGSIEAAPFGGAEMLTIAQTYQTHRQIDELFKAMRKIMKKSNGQGLPTRERPTGDRKGGMGMGSVPPAPGRASNGAEGAKVPPADK